MTLTTKVLIGVAIILAAFTVYLLLKKPKEPLVDNKAVQEAQYYKDANGMLVARLKQNAVNEKQMKANIDSLAKALKVKPKFIKGVDTYHSTVEIEYKDTSSSVIIGKDTAYKIEKHDPYVDIVAIAGKDSGSISLQMRDTLTRVEVVKTSLFKATTREVLIRNASPYTKVVSGYAYTIKEKRAILTVGPYLGIDIKGKPSFGLSVQYPLIQIKR